MINRKELIRALDSLITRNLQGGLRTQQLVQLLNQEYRHLVEPNLEELAALQLQDLARTRLKRLVIQEDPGLQISIEGTDQFFMPSAIVVPSDDGHPVWYETRSVNYERHEANVEMIRAQIAADSIHLDLRESVLKFHRNWERRVKGITLGEALKRAGALVEEDS